jgi:nicotinate-nucleotide adenylyltransferase
MGGTFDPIHYGHLVTAEAARAQFGLDQVLFMPAGTPPHKSQRADVAPAEDRYAMTELATRENASFEVSRMEIDREGPSWTIDTVRELRAAHPQDLELYFITGADAVLEILTWREHGEIARLARFIAATRPGYSLDRLQDAISGGHLPAVEVMEIPALAISSSDIRQRVRDGRPIRYLTPDAVVAYIARHGLYREAAA